VRRKVTLALWPFFFPFSTITLSARCAVVPACRRRRRRPCAAAARSGPAFAICPPARVNVSVHAASGGRERGHGAGAESWPTLRFFASRSTSAKSRFHAEGFFPGPACRDRARRRERRSANVIVRCVSPPGPTRRRPDRGPPIAATDAAAIRLVLCSCVAPVGPVRAGAARRDDRADSTDGAAWLTRRSVAGGARQERRAGATESGATCRSSAGDGFRSR